MKMFGKKSLSQYLFYGTRFTAFVIIGLVVFILLSLLTRNMSVVDGRFFIDIPLVNFQIKGFYKAKIFFSICSTLIFYASYVYVLSLVFESFKADKIFTERTVNYLKYFSILNLVLFPSAYLATRFLADGKGINLPYIILHVIIGILSLFLMSVFNRGYNVQSENDLTI